MTKRRNVFLVGGIAASLIFLAIAGALVLTLLPGSEAILSPLEATNTSVPEMPELIQPVSADIAQPVMQATGFSLKTGIRDAGLITGERTTYLNLMLVSTGEFDTLTVNRQPIDVTYAYLLTKNGVMRLPIPIGFRDGENYYSLSGSASEFTQVDREVFLAEMRQALPKGQPFGLNVLHVSYKNGVDRSDCARDWAPAWCELAREYNLSFGDAERQFVSKVITNKSWMPIGWLFYLYPSDDPKSQIVLLP